VIEPWSADDHELLVALNGDSEQMAHVGGAETAERIARRQADYERPGSLQFRIVDPASGAGAGWVGAWEREWSGERVYEVGWSVLPAFQGRGLAARATRELLARLDGLRYVHAFPAVDNGPSNAICRKVGFELLGPVEFEYPPGTLALSNDWRYDLRA
jgi:RimJ/RimL family protein N-acetyltransferase